MDIQKNHVWKENKLLSHHVWYLFVKLPRVQGDVGVLPKDILSLKKNTGVKMDAKNNKRIRNHKWAIWVISKYSFVCCIVGYVIFCFIFRIISGVIFQLWLHPRRLTWTPKMEVWKMMLTKGWCSGSMLIFRSVLESFLTTLKQTWQDAGWCWWIFGRKLSSEQWKKGLLVVSG